ncbi:MAG: hypothetical protein ACFFAS_10950 [Promethearchaeota archaeon]
MKILEKKKIALSLVSIGITLGIIGILLIVIPLANKISLIESEGAVFLILSIVFITAGFFGLGLLAPAIMYFPQLMEWQFSGVVKEIKKPENIRNCVSCGRRIPWDANLCPYCGHKYS